MSISENFRQGEKVRYLKTGDLVKIVQIRENFLKVKDIETEEKLNTKKKHLQKLR